jgi:hypothetical protein
MQVQVHRSPLRIFLVIVWSYRVVIREEQVLTRGMQSARMEPEVPQYLGIVARLDLLLIYLSSQYLET